MYICTNHGCNPHLIFVRLNFKYYYYTINDFTVSVMTECSLLLTNTFIRRGDMCRQRSPDNMTSQQVEREDPIRL